MLQVLAVVGAALALAVPPVVNVTAENSNVFDGTFVFKTNGPIILTLVTDTPPKNDTFCEPDVFGIGIKSKGSLTWPAHELNTTTSGLTLNSRSGFALMPTGAIRYRCISYDPVWMGFEFKVFYKEARKLQLPIVRFGDRDVLVDGESLPAHFELLEPFFPPENTSVLLPENVVSGTSFSANLTQGKYEFTIPENESLVTNFSSFSYPRATSQTPASSYRISPRVNAISFSNTVVLLLGRDVNITIDAERDGDEPRIETPKGPAEPLVFSVLLSHEYLTEDLTVTATVDTGPLSVVNSLSPQQAAVSLRLRGTHST